THRARHKIRQWFNTKALAETVATGRAKVEKELKRTGAGQANLEELASRLGFKKPDELFAAVAREEINLRQLGLKESESKTIKVEKKAKPSQKGSVLIV